MSSKEDRMLSYEIEKTERWINRLNKWTWWVLIAASMFAVVSIAIYGSSASSKRSSGTYEALYWFMAISVILMLFVYVPMNARWWRNKVRYESYMAVVKNL